MMKCGRNEEVDFEVLLLVLVDLWLVQDEWLVEMVLMVVLCLAQD